MKQKGLDIVIAIDTSKSMLAQDIAPNRLQRAKLAALDLLKQAKSDRLGLVAFAGTAFLQCPLTIDDVVFRQSLDSLNVNTLPQGGTALAEAIETATTAFKEGDSFKVVVLFSDGEDHEPGAVEAAEKAKKSGVILFTIGIGSEKGEVLRIPGANGQMDYVRDEDGNAVMSKLNEPLLQQLAGPAPQGFYLPLRGATTIETLYQRGLAPLPKSESQEKWLKQSRDRYHWPLAVAIALLIGEMFFPERKRENRAPRVAAASGAAVAPLLILLALLIPSGALASTSTALNDYKAGKFKEAQKEYERLAAIDKTGDARLEFNAGAAAYQGTNYEAALKLFGSALAARDVNLQAAAYFNIGNTHYRMGANAKDLDALETEWREAIKNFENALAINKTDPDALHNLAFVKRQVEAIEQLREAVRRAREDADQAIRRRNYHRALQIMEQQVQNNVAAKPFEDFVKKLKEIDEIATPAQP